MMIHQNLTGLFLLLTLSCHVTQIFVCGEPLGYNQESLVLWRSIILGTMDPSVVTPVDIVQVPDSCAGNIQAKADG